MRRPDWRRALAAHMARHRDQPHVWGARDCCLSVADAVAAMTGHDFAAPLRGYCNRFGALRALRRAGHASVAGYLDALFQRTPRPQLGDVVGFDDGPLNTLLIADGRGGGWGQAADGLMHMKLPGAAMAWSIDHG